MKRVSKGGEWPLPGRPPDGGGSLHVAQDAGGASPSSRPTTTVSHIPVTSQILNPTHPQPWRLRLQLHLSRVVASNVESCVTNVCTIVKGSGTLNVRPPHACVRRGSGIVVDIERYKIYYFTTKSMTVFCASGQLASQPATAQPGSKVAGV